MGEHPPSFSTESWEGGSSSSWTGPASCEGGGCTTEWGSREYASAPAHQGRGGASPTPHPRLQRGVGALTFTLCLKLRAMLRGVRVIHREGSGPGWGRGCGIAH